MTQPSENKKTILLIEDEPIISRVCVKTLTADGYEVDIATNGLIAKDMANKKVYDVFLSDIRTPEMSRAASDISALPETREGLLSIQRELGKHGAAVLEGRDIGTVVFPKADRKFYMDAAIEVRGERRFKELRAKGIKISLEEVIEQIRQRDYNDSNRRTAPLKKADDAIYIDSSSMTLSQAVDKILNYI